MKPAIPKILFDARDHKLLEIVNEVSSKESPIQYAKKLFYPYFHPSGIKEMSETKGLRIAYAVAYLLHSLEAGKIDDRLIALRSLRDEILTTPSGPLPKNTARVLLEIMKELVRSKGDYLRQLELAHDFRTSASGKPRIIRKLLRRYHLLEMPEEWNQIVFDDHVHDVSTKGRKSATHLIMDAWIKGIRRLRVIYYNHIQHTSVAELLEAARIMGVDVRIGIEFSARLRGKYIQLIWVPRYFPDPQDFMCFLMEPAMMELLAEGRAVSRYQQQYVTEVLKAFNTLHRHDLSKRLGIDITPVDSKAFEIFVGTGQASLVHLGQFIHAHIHSLFKSQNEDIQNRYAAAADLNERTRIENQIAEMNRLQWESLVEQYLKPEKNPSLHNPNVPQESSDVPSLLYLSPAELVQRLASLRSAYRFTLNLSNLDVIDVLEILYDCKGLITRLEIYNLKDRAQGKTDHIPEINELQQELNQSNVPKLKRLIQNLLERLKKSETSSEPSMEKETQARITKLSIILYDIGMLKDLYKLTRLKSRIGSDSTGRSPKMPGMGLAIKETLPKRAQRDIERSVDSRYEMIPFHITVYRRVTYIPPSRADKRVAGFWGIFLHHTKRKDWEVKEYSTRMQSPGNIVTLGGIIQDSHQDVLLTPPASEKKRTKISWGYMNTWVKNGLKVLFGFIPAFASFFFTYDWWVLSYFGAFIWFGITGLRNIIQSVLGGGGIRRSPLLRWNDYVSWDRLTDSLLFTGFSVPLLDLMVKNLALDQAFGINTTTAPALLYGIMALANGIYLSSHNALRGLPRGAVLGNFFRSVLSIPLAIAFNMAAGGMLSSMNVANVNDVLQKWAAVISKLASDCVACIIEGIADRHQNILMRRRDYETKLTQLFDTYAQLELMLPETLIMESLSKQKTKAPKSNIEAMDMERIMMIHALDMMYFWMYQPRSRHTLRQIFAFMTPDEKEIFMGTQQVLRRHMEIAQMFIDGILGRNFMKPLAFYLERSENYLKDLQKVGLTNNQG